MPTRLSRPRLSYRFKGELVQDKEGAELRPSMEFVRENPMKTAPNQLTSKQEPEEAKG